MRLEEIEWPSGQPLTDDYIQRFDRVKGLYDYNPWSKEDWRSRAAWLDSERPAGADRNGLAEALRSFNERAGNVPETMASVELLRNPRTLCVVGGQQASLFTGPLLVAYKAITVIQAARQASALLERPVVPVFWIAGEDHDFDEVNHTYFLTSDLKVEKIKVERGSDIRTSVSQTELSPEQWEDALASLDQSLLPTEFKARVLGLFRSAAEGSKTLTDAFAKLMAALFGRYGLVLLDSDDAGLRQLEGSMFRKLIERNGEIGQALKHTRTRLESLGYTPQTEEQPNGANLFVYDERGERTLLFVSDNGETFTDRRKTQDYSKAQLLEWADRSPQRLSNNVMTRPLMQDFVLPVLGVVLGPAEIAYWGLTRGAFHTLGMRMPVLLPRLGFTLLEGAVQKHMPKLGLSMDDVRFRLEEKRQQWLEAQDRWNLKERFSEVKEQFKEAYGPLIATAAEINPGLQQLGETNVGKIMEQMDYFLHKAEDGLRLKNEAGLRQFARIGQSIMPGGRLQERVLNVAAYLTKHGDDWLDELVQQSLDIDGKHRIFYL